MKDKKMQVLYLEQTGHILAAFTRNSGDESLLDVKGMMGADLVLCNLEIRVIDKANWEVTELAGGETLAVPVELLKAQVVEWNDSVFAMPYNFMVGGGQAVELQDGLLGNGDCATLTTTSIMVDAGSAVSEDTTVWAQVQERETTSCSEPVRMIVAGTIKPVGSVIAGSGEISDGRSVTLDLRPRPDAQPASILAPKSEMRYSVLVLVAGRRPKFNTLPS